MSNNKYASFYAAYNASVAAGNPNSKEDVVEQFTEGRTKSLKELSEWELQELVRRLNLTPSPSPKERGVSYKGDKMRKSIIAIFRSMNRTVEDAKAWAEKQGVRGVKKKFNDYSNGELFTLIRIAEKVRSDWQLAIRNKMKTL